MENTYETDPSNRVRHHSGRRRSEPLRSLIDRIPAGNKLFVKYALGPLFIVSITAYMINKSILLFGGGVGIDIMALPPFMRNHFNDLFTIPVMLTFHMAVVQKLGLRSDDEDYNTLEVIAFFGIWSFLFEFAMPMVGHGVGDPLDVIAYAVGAVAFLAVYRPPLLPKSFKWQF